MIDETGIDTELLIDDIVTVPSEEAVISEAPGQALGSENISEAERYRLFSLSEMETFQSEYVDRLEDHIQRLSASDAAFQYDTAWRKKKVLEWSTSAASQRVKETGDQKWSVLPSLLLEYMYGVYGIDAYLSEPEVSEIYINGPHNVWTTMRNGDIIRRQDLADNDEDFMSIVQIWVRLFSTNNERLDLSTPEVSLTLPNGDRMHVVAYLGDEVAYVTVRRHDYSITDLESLVARTSMSEPVARFLRAAVKGKCNIIAAGATNSGKTSLLRCLLTTIGEKERVIIIEDTQEIHFAKFAPNRNIVEFRARKANAEGQGEISMTNLIKKTLRMSPDRVIVGEVRGGEVTAMLLSMSQGNDGSMATIHADSAKDAISRMEQYLMLFPEAQSSITTETARSTIRKAVDLIVFQGRGPRDIPRMREIVVVDSRTPGEDGEVLTGAVARWDPHRRMAVPTNQPLPRKVEAKLAEGGWEGWEYELGIQ